MQYLNTTINADVIEGLKLLPDESVHTCVTSPPYWGLRNYGTGKWIGGDLNCDHVEREIRTGLGLQKLEEKYRGSGKKQGKVDKLQYKSICDKCGAIREDKQLGLEETPEEYISKMVKVFREVKRVLRDDGTLWLNIGDSYASNGKNRTKKQATAKSTLNGSTTTQEQVLKQQSKIVSGLKPKDLIGIPWMLAFALRADGWYLRQDNIWHKPNPMPESVKDRCTKAHEYIFLLSKSQKYYYDNEAIKTNIVESVLKDKRLGDENYEANRPDRCFPGANSKGGGLIKPKHGKYKANKKSVWTVTTKPFKEAHFATFPQDLIADCIKAGAPPNGIVLDPFMGSGTTGIVARKLERNYVGIELNPDYIKIENKRKHKELGMFK